MFLFNYLRELVTNLLLISWVYRLFVLPVGQPRLLYNNPISLIPLHRILPAPFADQLMILKFVKLLLLLLFFNIPLILLPFYAFLLPSVEVFNFSRYGFWNYVDCRSPSEAKHLFGYFLLRSVRFLVLLKALKLLEIRDLEPKTWLSLECLRWVLVVQRQLWREWSRLYKPYLLSRLKGIYVLWNEVLTLEILFDLNLLSVWKWRLLFVF